MYICIHIGFSSQINCLDLCRRIFYRQILNSRTLHIYIHTYEHINIRVIARLPMHFCLVAVNSYKYVYNIKSKFKPYCSTEVFVCHRYVSGAGIICQQNILAKIFTFHICHVWVN